MAPSRGFDARRVVLSAHPANPVSDATAVASYDLNKVIAAVRGWQEQAAAAPDPVASEAYRRSAAQYERLVLRSLATPPIC